LEILKYFKETKIIYTLFILKEGERIEFLKELPIEYKDCYIPDDELLERIKNFSSTKENELSEILPTLGNIQSGDFGEILSFFLFKEKFKKQNVDGPKKWRWKQDKDVAAPYTDVLLFSINGKKPSINDLLISIESKMKATLNKNYHPIQNAINGSEKDYVSRIANTLSWLRKKNKDESLKKNAPITQLNYNVSLIERFIKSEIHGEYSKKFIAVAIVDNMFLKEEIRKGTSFPINIGPNLKVVVVSIKKLQRAYQDVFTKIPTS